MSALVTGGPDSRSEGTPHGHHWAHDTVDILGVRVSVVDPDLLLRYIREAIKTRYQLTVTFANPHYVMAAQRDEELRGLMNAFDLNLADGWGVVLAARMLGTPLPTRMANDDITDGLFGEPAGEGWPVFLFGSPPGVAEQAAANLTEWYPGLVIAGTEHGRWRVDGTRFHPDDVDRIIATINAARPSILHVCVATPLQQTFVAENRHRLDVPVIITGGGYLDHLSERRQWYPRWVLRLRIGWLYRLVREPRRLWRRYTIELADYLWHILRQRLRQGRPR